MYAINYRTKDVSSSLQLLATWRFWVIFDLYIVIIVTHLILKALTVLNPKFMKVHSKLVENRFMSEVSNLQVGVKGSAKTRSIYEFA